MVSKQPTIIVTGANGFVGENLVTSFARTGWRVRALVRNPEQYPRRRNVVYITYDMGRSFDQEAIFKGADYLVHTAYVKYNRQHPDAFQINLTAAERLLACSRAYKLKKNVFISTMSAHSEAESVYGKQKLAIEKLFDTRCDAVLRSGLIIGNGGLVKQMASFMKTKHAVPLIGGGKQPLQIIAVYDLVRVIERILVGKLSGIYTVATPEVYSYREFYQMLARNLGIRVFFVPVPFFVLVSIIQLISFLHLPLGVSKDNALGLKKLTSTDTSQDLKALGMTLDPLDVALQKSKVLI